MHQPSPGSETLICVWFLPPPLVFHVSIPLPKLHFTWNFFSPTFSSLISNILQTQDRKPFLIATLQIITTPSLSSLIYVSIAFMRHTRFLLIYLFVVCLVCKNKEFLSVLFTSVSPALKQCLAHSKC